MAELGARRAAVRTAQVDWAARWGDLVERRETQTRSAWPGEQNRWDGRAEQFARLADEVSIEHDFLLKTLSEAISPEDTVIDAGAGAGRYTALLASMARHVTAVEPSAGMRAALAKGVEARGLTNVSIVEGTWQDAAVEPHDVVVCSHVVYFVRDIIPFIEKLDATAKRASYVYLRVDARDLPFGPLWREVWGEDRAPEAGFLDFYNLLFGLGIRAEVSLGEVERASRYRDIEDATDQTRQTLGLAADDHRFDERIRAFLAERLEPAGDRLAFPPFTQTAIVWWEK